MLEIDQIEKRAQRRYLDLLKAWGDFESMFPLRLPLGKVIGGVSAVSRWVQELKTGSQQASGYRLLWREVNSREYGRNQFPTHAEFESAEHLAGFLGKSAQWCAYDQWMARVQQEFPDVVDALRRKPSLVLSILPHGGDFLTSLRWMLANPNPGCYLREIPDLPHSKFVEEHEAGFRFFLERLLPGELVDKTQGAFERRFGFKKREHFFICRLLDDDLQASLAWPSAELAFHPENLGCLGEQFYNKLQKVLIVENQVNLHTMPPETGTLAIHGSGFAVLRLAKAAPWLSKLPVEYWGDLDVQGFEILSDLRAILPKVKSRWMDGDGLRDLRKFASKGVPSQRSAPNLHETEQVAYRWCRRFQRRIEQERVPL